MIFAEIELYRFSVNHWHVSSLLVQNIQKDNQNSGSRPQSTPSKRNTVQSHEAVSAIFKLISDKETKQEGIQKLYEFKVCVR